MKRIQLLTLITALVTSGVALAQVPALINYQGRLSTSGTNLFNGEGQFKLALVSSDANATYWSNDGTGHAGGEPTQGIRLLVKQGLFSINLGDTSLSNMTAEIPASIFTNSDVRLRIWFSDGLSAFQQFYPDQRLTSAGYTMIAANVLDGAITSSKLAQAAVGANAIAANAIRNTNIAAGAINTAQLADSAVTASKLAAGVLSGFQNSMAVFSNSATWTRPPGVSMVRVKLWGGGQGGRYRGSSYGNYGGNAGGYCEGVVAVTGNVAVEVGLGGARGYGNGVLPGDGGNSSFLSLTANGGNGSGGGTASGGQLNLTGNPFDALDASYGGKALMGAPGWGEGGLGGQLCTPGNPGLVIVYY